MRTAACLHPNQARRQLNEKLRYLQTLQLLAQYDLASRINPVDLKNQLCQIDSNLGNVHLGRSCWFKWLLDTSTLAQLMPLKVGASMPLTVVSPGAIWITGAPTACSCRDQTGHTGSRAPKSAGSMQRSRGV